MKIQRLNSRFFLTSTVALTAILPVTACDLTNNHLKIDRSTNSEVQDYRDMMAPREVSPEVLSNDEGAIPDFQSYVSDDTSSMRSMPLVSLSINQSIPLREALFELAKQADFDVEIDPRITGSVIYTARNRPFDEVIERLCAISGLRYKFEGNSMRVEIDTPYSKNYKIDYLSFVRKSDSKMATDVSVSSSGDAKSGGGSKFEMASTSESDFWKELDTNLKQIIASNSNSDFLKTSEDPTISLTSSNPPAPPIDAAALSDTSPQAGVDDYVSAPTMIDSGNGVVSPPDEESLKAASSENSVTPSPATAEAPNVAQAEQSPVSTPSAQPVGEAVAPLPQQPQLTVQSLPTTANPADDSISKFTPTYSINRQAGIISVYGNERLHKQVATYLDLLRKATTSQVLIEAKVLEVSLTDEFSAGVNWNLLDNIGDFTVTGPNFAEPGLTPPATGSFSFGVAGNDLSAFVSALSRFGTVHALASPRLTVLNNQSAILSVARNQVYFELDVTVEQSTVANVPGTTTVNSEIKTVPEGVIINVMPSIDVDNRTISMQVRPTVTKIVDYVSDPGVAFVSQTNKLNLKSDIPVMNVQEVDSVLNIKDKQMMVMGGLLQDETTSTQTGVPVASEIPLFGGLFRNQGDKVSKKELVIFMKATILDENGNTIHQTDRDLYRVFGQDRRPHKL